MVVALILTAIGMAASSTLCGAVMVENGKQTGLTGKFVSQQWIWFSIAGIATSLGGGWLCQHLTPTSAFHTAALITAFAPLGVMAGAWFLIAEKKSQANPEQLKLSLKGLIAALKSRTLWIVAALLALWNFSPGFGTPLYFHMTDQLMFSQEFIGILGAVGSVGAVIGSLVYMKWLDRRFTLRQLLYVSIVLGTLSQAAYVLLHTEKSALVLTVMTAVATQVALLTMLTLAANSCPDKSEGFSYAALMSVFNLAAQASAVFGGKLYAGDKFFRWHQPHFMIVAFQNHLTPLIWLSAVVTAAGFFFVPFLPKGLDHKDLAAK
jgi:predicted MFS family arabinose efflux permease